MISHFTTGFLAAPSLNRRDEAGAKSQALIHTDVGSRFNFVTTRSTIRVNTPPRTTRTQLPSVNHVISSSYENFRSRFSQNPPLTNVFNRLKKGGLT
jgi:hypothetical protein